MATLPDRGRFRVRSGLLEVEYEGPLASIASKFESAVLLVGNSGEDGIRSPTGPSEADLHMIDRGVDVLVAEDWFLPRRTVEETMVELANRGVPLTGTSDVSTVLDRQVRHGKMRSTILDWHQVYWCDIARDKMVQ